VIFNTELTGTVEPRNGEHRSPSEVPDMNVTSNTISSNVVRDVRVSPTTVPCVAIGTRPESCTYTTRSPRVKR
jgi:hypothetical protein